MHKLAVARLINKSCYDFSTNYNFIKSMELHFGFLESKYNHLESLKSTGIIGGIKELLVELVGI